MENMSLEYVTGVKWTAEELNGRTAYKQVMGSNFDPRVIMMPGKLSAEKHEGGMILQFISTNREGKEVPWSVSQTEADALRLNQQAEFEIPLAL
jgi:hypothetical protein